MFLNSSGIVIFAFTLTVMSTVEADIYTGAGGAIPDGTLGFPGVLSSQIDVPDSFQITDVTVTLLGAQHTWIGDLAVTLTHEVSQTSVVLFDRVGLITPPGFGDSSNLGGDYLFNDAFAGDLWAAAAATTGFNPVPPGDYAPSGRANAASSLSAFTGEIAAGTWTLTIEDYAGENIGSIVAWELSLVPAPSTIPLLALAAGLATRARRRDASADRGMLQSVAS